jgi:CheY-like chemotaxis protein
MEDSAVPQHIPAIIVVEDEPHILAVVRRVLRDLQLDYDIITVDNAASALAQATHHRCPLLITDYLLPGPSGLDLAREFKARYRSAVIMMTAYATPELLAETQAAEIDHFLPKPFLIGDLERAVSSALAR